MYRIHTPSTNIPILCSPAVLRDYSENRVDTLHLKNLLHLGEDRYLTTLMMKHFAGYKLIFTVRVLLYFDIIEIMFFINVLMIGRCKMPHICSVAVQYIVITKKTMD